MKQNPLKLIAVGGAFLFSSVLALVLVRVFMLGTEEGWHTDFHEAKALAAKTDKLMLVEFHGSDWCPPCIQLNDEILSTAEFKDYAEGRFVLVDLDFPRRKTQDEATQKANHALAEEYGIQGFPTVLVMNADGKVLGRSVGFPQGGKEGFMQFLAKHSQS